MNVPTTKYDLSLYTKDPWVYIGFNHIESSEDEENDKIHLNRQEIRKTTKEMKTKKKNETLIGNKRESSKEISKLRMSSRSQRANENAVKETKAEKKSDLDNHKAGNITKEESSRKNKMCVSINMPMKNSEEEIKSPIIPNSPKSPTSPKSLKKTIKDKSNSSVNTYSQINAKKNITNALTSEVANENTEKNIIESKLKKTLIQNDIFNTELNIDFKPQIREEYRLKRTFEVRIKL